MKNEDDFYFLWEQQFCGGICGSVCSTIIDTVMWFVVLHKYQVILIHVNSTYCIWVVPVVYDCLACEPKICPSSHHHYVWKILKRNLFVVLGAMVTWQAQSNGIHHNRLLRYHWQNAKWRLLVGLKSGNLKRSHDWWLLLHVLPSKY